MIIIIARTLFSQSSENIEAKLSKKSILGISSKNVHTEAMCKKD
jgi:hypothetical protein